MCSLSDQGGRSRDDGDDRLCDRNEDVGDQRDDDGHVASPSLLIRAAVSAEVRLASVKELFVAGAGFVDGCWSMTRICHRWARCPRVLPFMGRTPSAKAAPVHPPPKLG